MHPPEAHGPADRSDATQHERHYFEIVHGKLRNNDSENPLDACTTMKAPAILAAGVSVLAKRFEPLQLRLGRCCRSFFRLVVRQRFR